MNDWSFGQVCRLAGVAKETVDPLTPDTAMLNQGGLLRRQRQGCTPLRSVSRGSFGDTLHNTVE